MHDRTGVRCLQGGAEFSDACRGMDTLVLERSPGGPVVILAAAVDPGAGYEAAGTNALRYYRSLGVDDVHVAPDPRADRDAAAALVEQAALLVLPGGSPHRLLDALCGDDGGQSALGRLVVRRNADGMALSGASAGAMVLARHCLLPGRRFTVRPGLGLTPGAVLPHYSSGDDDADSAWVGGWAGRARDLAGPEAVLLGLPECSGLLFGGTRVQAVGAAASTILSGAHERRVEPGEVLPATPWQGTEGPPL